MLTRYADAAGLTHSISPHQLRHFPFTWLKIQGIDDALANLSPAASRYRRSEGDAMMTAKATP